MTPEDLTNSRVRQLIAEGTSSEQTLAGEIAALRETVRMLLIWDGTTYHLEDCAALRFVNDLARERLIPVATGEIEADGAPVIGYRPTPEDSLAMCEDYCKEVRLLLGDEVPV